MRQRVNKCEIKANFNNNKCEIGVLLEIIYNAYKT